MTTPRWARPVALSWLLAAMAAAAVLAHTLIGIDPQYPVVDAQTRKDLRAVRRSLEAEAPPGVPADPYEAKERGRKRKHGGKGSDR